MSTFYKKETNFEQTDRLSGIGSCENLRIRLLFIMLFRCSMFRLILRFRKFISNCLRVNANNLLTKNIYYIFKTQHLKNAVYIMLF